MSLGKGCSLFLEHEGPALRKEPYSRQGDTCGTVFTKGEIVQSRVLLLLPETHSAAQRARDDVTPYDDEHPRTSCHTFSQALSFRCTVPEKEEAE